MPATMKSLPTETTPDVNEIVRQAQADGDALIAQMPRGVLVVADGSHLQHVRGTTYALGGSAEFDLSIARDLSVVDAAEVPPQSYYMIGC